MDNCTQQLPDWLSAAPPVTKDHSFLPRYPRTKDELELEQATFEALFERVLDGIAEGLSTTLLVSEDPRKPNYGRFIRWIKKDPERTRRYEEAQEIATEYIMAQMDMIADGTEDNLEDLERSKLRLAHYKFKLQVYNRRRYGDKQQVEVTNNTTVSIRNILEEREKRLQQLSNPNIVDGDYEMVTNVADN